MNTTRKVLSRDLWTVRETSDLIRTVLVGLATFFALFPWFMLGAFIFHEGDRTASGTSAIVLLVFLATLSLFHRLTAAAALHWNEYPYYPEDPTAIRQYHHVGAMIAVACIMLFSWSWGLCVLVILGLCGLDLLFNLLARTIGEGSVRSLKARYDSMLNTLTAISGSLEKTNTLRLPEIYYPEESSVNEAGSHTVPEDPHLTQYQTRKTQEDGSETIEGMVCVHFREKEEQTVIHLAFCPSMTGVPEIETETVAETEVEAVVTLVQMYGARIELRRHSSHAGGPLPDESVSLYYYASVPCVSGKMAK